ncbi:MAG TPA: hypothetical protein VIC26_02145 [Marinagarivorans sp.]
MDENKHFILGLLDLGAGAIIAGLIAAAVLYLLMFKGFEDFAESIKYWLTSQYRHSDNEMLSGEWWQKTKIFIWLGLTLAIAVLVNGMLG